ncbi:hypothetical protein JHW43_006242 [Diplocarpon mali]|nr:hypothetical protein JHW43_006242 [Diplocarpon mali]
MGGATPRQPTKPSSPARRAETKKDHRHHPRLPSRYTEVCPGRPGDRPRRSPWGRQLQAEPSAVSPLPRGVEANAQPAQRGVRFWVSGGSAGFPSRAPGTRHVVGMSVGLAASYPDFAQHARPLVGGPSAAPVRVFGGVEPLFFFGRRGPAGEDPARGSGGDRCAEDDLLAEDSQEVALDYPGRKGVSREGRVTLEQVPGQSPPTPKFPAMQTPPPNAS